MSDTQVGKNAVAYINNNQLSSTPATFVSASEASGLVKVKIKIGTSSFDSYVTKDGKLLFPQAYDMTTKKASTAAASNTNTAPLKRQRSSCIHKKVATHCLKRLL